MHSIKAQGSLDYSLLVGSVILVAAMVLGIVFSGSGSTKEPTQKIILDTLCAKSDSQAECENMDPDMDGPCKEKDCSWTENRCIGSEDRTEGCFGGTGQILGLCGDEKCEEGDGICEEDIDDCEHQACKTEFCSDGCVFLDMEQGIEDPGYCDSAIGCIELPCVCNGTGDCVSSDAETCGDGPCLGGDGYCPDDVADCESERPVCQSAACIDGCQYSDIPNGQEDAGRCDFFNQFENCTELPCVCNGFGLCRHLESQGPGPSCGNGSCDSGDGECPSDAKSCEPATLCQTMQCIDGCQYSNIEDGQEDTGKCDSETAGTGCETAPCVCNGSGECRQIEEEPCGNGICEAGDGECPDDVDSCEHQLCQTVACMDGCEYTDLEDGTEDAGYCDTTIGCHNKPCVCNGSGECEDSVRTLLEDCGEISEPGTYYLEGNIDNEFYKCLEIAAVGTVIIDCQGNTIIGGPAILMPSATDLELEECIIEGMGIVGGNGIELSGSDTASVSCSASTYFGYGMAGGARFGIRLDSASNKTVTGCNINQGFLAGIAADNSNYNTIQNCSVDSGFTGIGIVGQDNIIINNYVTGNISHNSIVIGGYSMSNSQNNLISNNFACGSAKRITISDYGGQHPDSGNNTCNNCSDIGPEPSAVCPCENSCP